MLPIHAVIPDLVAALARGRNAVVVAPPGAGKTTGVPPALLNAAWRGDGRILLLEPRRLAARAAARRMAAELGEPAGQRVGYRMRLDRKVSAATRIEVITEGVFTARILADPSLEGVAAVLFDEIHERSLDGDLGLALALDAQAGLRPDLRLVAMSATLDAARVAQLMTGPGGEAAVIVGEGRAYPVETRHRPRPAERRLEDAVADAVTAALAEEPGSALVFLPGQAEIRRAAERLAGRLPAAVDVVPLYGALTAAEQDRAIAPAPQDRRKVVLATSIAETSLTIEGVRIVVDSGLARVPVYEPGTGLTRLETRRVSRAAADQRRGRAGRTEPGVCFRLWPEGQTAALAAYDVPEILAADLAPLVLALADWGVSDPSALRWLGLPPRPAWTEAVALLRGLDALDDRGRLTEEGRALARLSLPPRLAHMVRRAAAEGETMLAAEIAVLLGEPGLGGSDSDLRHRLGPFRSDRSERAREARGLAERWAREAGGNPSAAAGTERAGRWLATAYPDRVAQARGAPGRYVLANGRGAQLDPADPLAREPFLAVAAMQGTAENARILLAAPLSRADIEEALGAHIKEETEAEFDRASGSVRARRRRRLGRLVLAEEPAADVPPGEIAAALIQGIRDGGLASLSWSRAAEGLRQRVGFLRQIDGERWPDLSDEALLATLESWLRPFLSGRTRLSEVGPDLLSNALAALLPWDLRSELDRLAPAEWQAPTGRLLAIDYADPAAPTLAVKVQELFGLDRHPAVAGGRVPLVLSLLSPAQRPIQVTRDLSAFWRGSWRDVRAEMRGRYPKHDWPEDPMRAAPTHRAKPRA